MQGGQVWPKRIAASAIDVTVIPVAPESPPEEILEPAENFSTGNVGANSPPVQAPLSWPAVSAFFEAVGRAVERPERSAPAPVRGADLAPRTGLPEPSVVPEVGGAGPIERAALGQEQAWAVSVIALGTLVSIYRQDGKPAIEEGDRHRQQGRVIR